MMAQVGPASPLTISLSHCLRYEEYSPPSRGYIQTVLLASQLRRQDVLCDHTYHPPDKMAHIASHDVLDTRAAEALHVEILPGTEVMRDIGDVHFAHAKGADGAVLVPHPSSSPDDPLNWSLTWKLTVAVSVLLYTWVLVTAALSLAPMFPFLGVEFHLNQTQLGLLTGINVLTLGELRVAHCTDKTMLIPCARLHDACRCASQ